MLRSDRGVAGEELEGGVVGCEEVGRLALAAEEDNGFELEDLVVGGHLVLHEEHVD